MLDGVVDLVPEHVETDSRAVRANDGHVNALLDTIHLYKPRFACVIHSKVRDWLNRSGRLARPLTFGWCGILLSGLNTEFLLNYFPNGNSIPDDPKVNLFRELRDRL
jgi:hypothetical protein